VLADISVIAKHFVDLERFTLVDAQHTLDLTADLAFVDESLHSSAGAQLRDPIFQDLMEYRKRLLDYMRVWAGLKPYPWLELGILVERQQGGTTSGIRPRRTESRLAMEEDRQRVIPGLEIRKWYSRPWGWFMIELGKEEWMHLVTWRTSVQIKD
jgi:hypothetical protein